MKRALALTLCALLLAAPLPARASDDEAVYTLLDESGQRLTSIGCRVYEGDEYIAGDDRLYRVTGVNDDRREATARCVGPEADAVSVFAALADAGKTGGSEKPVICMYSTHSDESYEPTDGEASLTRGAGIYDVDEALKRALEEQGFTVVLDRTSSLPHDAEAYARSRRIAEELLKKSPVALLDVHRDGIPDESEYELEVDGTEASKVRLLVGRSNPDSSANREFARRIKAAADKLYPGLVKDIFIGKGNYNQELFPQALLLEFGTHTLDKERAIKSTEYMAKVLSSVLTGASGKGAADRAAGNGVIWLILVAALATLVYALASTGSLQGAMARARRSAEEFTARRK